MSEMKDKKGFFSNLASIFYKNYLPFLNGIRRFNSILFTFYNVFITSLAIPVATGALILVEVVRVQHGLVLIEEDETLAWFGAIVLVLSNMVIEAMIVNINWEHGMRDEVHYKMNLRSFLNGLRGFFFMPPDLAQPAAKFKGVQRIITWAILFTAFYGTLNTFMLTEEFEEVYGNNPWHEVFIDILVNAPLNTFLNWVVTVLFTFVAVLASQRFAAFISFRALEAQEEIEETAQNIVKRENNEVIEDVVLASNSKKKLAEYLDVLNENDLLKVEPDYAFYDSERNKWSKDYKSLQSVYNIIDKVAMKRRRKKDTIE